VLQLSRTDEELMLASTASAFVAEHAPLSRTRKLRDDMDARGYDLALYARMADLGWMAIPFSEQDGGLGLGVAGAVVVTEAMGRGLAPEPYVPCIMLAAQVIALLGDEPTRRLWLRRAIDGSAVLALAHQERSSRYDLAQVTTRAVPTHNGFCLSGEKSQVAGAVAADLIVAVARTHGDAGDSQGLSLFLVPAQTKGLRVTGQRRIDSRNAAMVMLDQVEVPASALLGELGQALPALQTAVDRATVALCGEMVGAMAEAFERTVRYLKERRQFGVAIGSFQALKHRAARLLLQVELARSATLAAARALDAGQADARLLTSVAKAQCSDAYTLVANEAVQMHGGIGVTDEHDIGLFMKHARVCEITFGDAAFHRDRFASLRGY
jgi:alkylation response protein AidB-like acyl-CoA dehydrogenase